MPDVVGVRFQKCGRIYSFAIDTLDVKADDSVVVESDHGLSIGRVVKERTVIEKPHRELKKVIRLVTDEDIKTAKENKKTEDEARAFCIERIKARGIQMKLAAVQSALDRGRIVFYFTSDGRIDFRELVKDIASKFRTRIEMRQIGVRDETRLIGGISTCGRELCCSTYLTSFEPVSIKMAKKQDLGLNVGKLSGLCGRLMCCIRFEYQSDGSGIAIDKAATVCRCEDGAETVEEKIAFTGYESERLHETISDEGEAQGVTKDELVAGAPSSKKLDVKDTAKEGHKKISTRHLRKKRRLFRK
ncbi:MAG: stage 0 sporulation protein [Nitrospirae bacterium]|nr:stage 0 sporulation protein [Nitrospirota bacterium]